MFHDFYCLNSICDGLKEFHIVAAVMLWSCGIFLNSNKHDANKNKNVHNNTKQIFGQWRPSPGTNEHPSRHTETWVTPIDNPWSNLLWFKTIQYAVMNKTLVSRVFQKFGIATFDKHDLNLVPYTAFDAQLDSESQIGPKFNEDPRRKAGGCLSAWIYRC